MRKQLRVYISAVFATALMCVGTLICSGDWQCLIPFMFVFVIFSIVLFAIYTTSGDGGGMYGSSCYSYSIHKDIERMKHECNSE